MSEERYSEGTTIVRDIKKKHRLIHLLLFFVIIMLAVISFKYIYPPATSFLSFIPNISITLIIGIVFLLSFLGFYLSVVLSGQIFQLIEQYSSRLERMLEISRDLTSEVHGDILLEKILDSGMAITNSSAGSVLLLDENGQLIFKIARGAKSQELSGMKITGETGVAGWVVKNGIPARINSASEDSRFNPEFDSITGFKTKSILCVPLKTEKGIAGALELVNKINESEYSDKDEQIITYLAHHAAISIAKTSFYEDQKNYEIHVTEMLLDAIDFQMPDKQGHSRRVARYGNIIARALSMSEKEKKRLYLASLLHDVGFLKIHYDDSYKKEEFLRHSIIGYEMIKPINFLADIAPYILSHHERYDGFGYPSNQKGEEIPLEARIIAIAEAFDAMISIKTYRVPINFDSAIEELKNNAGTQFDPELVAVFINNIAPEHVVRQ